MEPPVDDRQTATSDNAGRPRGTGTAFGLMVVAVLILATVYYVHTTSEALDSRLADLDRRVDDRFAEQSNGVRTDIAALMTDLAAVSERVEHAVREADAVRDAERTLKRANDRTARTVATQAADVNTMQQTVAALSTDMNARVAGVSKVLICIGWCL
jgi:hypothetical protein